MTNPSDAEALQFVETLAAQQSEAAKHNPDATIRPMPLGETLAASAPSTGEMPSFFPRVATLGTSNTSDFEPLSLLGEGGMGRVMLAKQRSLRREVAIKSVRPSQRSAHTQRALLEEALCAA